MAGTHLVIVVNSDAGGYWWGRLQYSTDDGQYFSIDGREYDPNYQTYPGSCLPAAGWDADVWSFADAATRGFEFYTDFLSTPGKWFIFDYRAEQAGSCNLDLYDFSTSYDMPVETLTLTHVPSRDFNGDKVVDFEDFAVLASRWRFTMNTAPTSDEIMSDLNSDDRRDLGDLVLFSRYWLERTDSDDAPEDPNRPSAP